MKHTTNSKPFRDHNKLTHHNFKIGSLDPTKSDMRKHLEYEGYIDIRYSGKEKCFYARIK